MKPYINRADKYATLTYLQLIIYFNNAFTSPKCIQIGSVNFHVSPSKVIGKFENMKEIGTHPQMCTYIYFSVKVVNASKHLWPDIFTIFLLHNTYPAPAAAAGHHRMGLCNISVIITPTYCSNTFHSSRTHSVAHGGLISQGFVCRCVMILENKLWEILARTEINFNT